MVLPFCLFLSVIIDFPVSLLSLISRCYSQPCELHLPFLYPYEYSLSYEKFYGRTKDYFGCRCIICVEIVDEVLLEDRFRKKA